MTALALIQFSLFLLKTVLAQIHGTEEYAQIASGIQAAIDQIQLVHDTPVTRDQLESLRVEQKW